MGGPLRGGVKGLDGPAIKKNVEGVSKKIPHSSVTEKPEPTSSDDLITP